VIPFTFRISPNPNLSSIRNISKLPICLWRGIEKGIVMGIRYVSQYQKLESGKTANAELGTLAKLKKVFPAFSVDAVLE